MNQMAGSTLTLNTPFWSAWRLATLRNVGPTVSPGLPTTPTNFVLNTVRKESATLFFGPKVPQLAQTTDIQWRHTSKIVLH